MTEDLVTVLVVNWNGERYLEACLRSLERQTRGKVEVILVDNGSTDSSLELVRQTFPEVQVIALKGNLGFSAAFNAGIRYARGRYIALLNNDGEADSSWLEQLTMALDSSPVMGLCASKMLLKDQPGLADTCGDFYSAEGIPGKTGHLELETNYNVAVGVLGECAGAAMYWRSMLEELGGFDEDSFMNHEDSDLSFRARLLGHKCLYVPTAVVYHHLGATIGRQSDTAVYYAQRNMEFVFSKNMPTVLLLKYLPLHLITDLSLFLRYILHGQGLVFLRAKLGALVMTPTMLRKRREIQRSRRVSAAQIDWLLVKGYLWERLRHGFAEESEQAPVAAPGNRP